MLKNSQSHFRERTPRKLIPTLDFITATGRSTFTWFMISTFGDHRFWEGAGVIRPSSPAPNTPSNPSQIGNDGWAAAGRRPNVAIVPYRRGRRPAPPRTPGAGSSCAPDLRGRIGGGGWIRTTDIGLMRPPLYQLSYAATGEVTIRHRRVDSLRTSA
jgi:hypothetical protein